MTAWPSESDLDVAAAIGHIAHPIALVCSCDWKPKRGGVMPRTQLANHVWTVVGEAKRRRLEAVGGEYCRTCKGTGTDQLLGQRCATCGGKGFIPPKDETYAQHCVRVAFEAGHELVEETDACTCGDRGSWREHAQAVGRRSLEELEAFEHELRGA